MTGILAGVSYKCRIEAVRSGLNEARLQLELDQLAQTLGHSVSLDDADGHLIGYNAQAADADRARVQSILTRRIRADVLAHQRLHGIEIARGPVRVPGNPKLGMVSRICVPVGSDQPRSAFLWILDDAETLQPRELVKAGEAAKRLAKILANEQASARVADRLFAQAITQGPDAGDAAIRLRGLLRLNETPMRVAVVLATERGSRARETTSARPTADALRQLPLAAATDISTSRAAILLFPVRDVRSVCDAIGEALKASRHRQEMVVGMSAPAAMSADSLALLYAAASVAAGCAAVDPALPRCVSWPQLSLYRHLLTTSEHAPALVPIPTQPPSLLEQTLETFLDNACDVQRTTAALHIHRTTLYYRLARLRAAGFNLDDGLTRSDLHIALKQRRLELARLRFGWNESLVHSAGLAPAQEANSAPRFSSHSG